MDLARLDLVVGASGFGADATKTGFAGIETAIQHKPVAADIACHTPWSGDLGLSWLEPGSESAGCKRGPDMLARGDFYLTAFLLP